MAIPPFQRWDSFNPRVRAGNATTRARHVSAGKATQQRIESRSDDTGAGCPTLDPAQPCRRVGLVSSSPRLSHAASCTHIGDESFGNMLRDVLGNIYTYNAEGMTTSTSSGSTYTYGAYGQRVRKDVGSSWTEYINFNGIPLPKRTPTALGPTPSSATAKASPKPPAQPRRARSELTKEFQS